MIIRPFTSDDAAVVIAIHRASHSVPWSPSRFQAFATLVAEVDGQVVGFACHSVLHAPDREECLLLANLAVDPGHRRRGIGRALVEARLRIAAAAGIRKAMAITQVSNEACKALYHRYGFEDGARLPGYYDGTEDGLVLERALDPDAEPPWRDAAPSREDRTPCETLSEAIEASQQGQAEHALALVDGLVGHPKFDHVARGYRAHILDALERPVEAALEFERLVNETGAPWVHQALGDRYLAACLHGPALSHLLAAIPVASAEPNPRLWCALGVAWERLGRHWEACWAYGRLVRDDPNGAWGHARLATTMLHCGRPALALETADAGLRLDESLAELHKVRGLALWRLGRHAEARTTLGRALELGPDDRELPMHLGALAAEAEAPRL